MSNILTTLILINLIVTMEEKYVIIFLGTAFSIVGALFMSWKRNIDNRQTALAKEVTEVKDNYITRFESVIEKINTTEKTILKEISKINVMCATHYRPKKRVE